MDSIHGYPHNSRGTGGSPVRLSKGEDWLEKPGFVRAGQARRLSHVNALGSGRFRNWPWLHRFPNQILAGAGQETRQQAGNTFEQHAVFRAE